MACVTTMESMEYLLISEAWSLKKIKNPANIPKRGAVRKNLSGADMGGAWSIDSPLKSKSHSQIIQQS